MNREAPAKAYFETLRFRRRRYLVGAALAAFDAGRLLIQAVTGRGDMNIDTQLTIEQDMDVRNPEEEAHV